MVVANLRLDSADGVRELHVEGEVPSRGGLDDNRPHLTRPLDVPKGIASCFPFGYVETKPLAAIVDDVRVLVLVHVINSYPRWLSREGGRMRVELDCTAVLAAAVYDVSMARDVG